MTQVLFVKCKIPSAVLERIVELWYYNYYNRDMTV